MCLNLWAGLNITIIDSSDLCLTYLWCITIVHLYGRYGGVWACWGCWTSDWGWIEGSTKDWATGEESGGHPSVCGAAQRACAERHDSSGQTRAGTGQLYISPQASAGQNDLCSEVAHVTAGLITPSLQSVLTQQSFYFNQQSYRGLFRIYRFFSTLSFYASACVIVVFLVFIDKWREWDWDMTQFGIKPTAWAAQLKMSLMWSNSLDSYIPKLRKLLFLVLSRKLCCICATSWLKLVNWFEFVVQQFHCTFISMLLSCIYNQHFSLHPLSLLNLFFTELDLS